MAKVVKINEELHKEVKYWAISNGMKLQFVIETLIEEFLEKKKKKKEIK